jgi:apolipoprotein N-acyltransferase
VTRARLALTLAFALLFALAFDFRAGALHFDVGIALGWLALAPLWLLIRGQRPWAAFRRVWLATWLGYAGVFWWLYIVITVFGNAPAIAGVGGALAVAAYCALCAGLAGAVTAALVPHAGRLTPLVLPAAWILAERVRALESVAAFPWAFLGYAAHADGPMRGLSSLTGIYGLSALLALSGVLLAERRFVAAVALCAVLHAVGWIAIPRPAASDAKPPRVAMVQGNIPQDEKWNPTLESQNFEIHYQLTRQALAGHPDLITWAEAGVPGFLFQPGGPEERRYPFLEKSQLEFRDPLLALARESRVTLLVGGLGLTLVDGQHMPLLHNSVYVISPEGQLVDRHDKTVLVPFGEYVPLRALFGSLQAVASGLAEVGDATPGRDLAPAKGLEVLGPDHAATPLICYEVVYPGIVRRAVREGARLLLNPTNDAWYGRSSAPHQFLAIAQMRSAEHGVPMLRDANTGVSALIDAGGRIVAETPLFERTVLTVDALPAVARPTFYTRVGDWPLWAGAALLAGLGGNAVVRRRRR